MPRSAAACPACGATLAETLIAEPQQDAVSSSPATPRRIGTPVALMVFFVGFASLGAAIGLLAAGHWAWGLVLLGVAVLLLVGLAEVTRHGAPDEAGPPIGPAEHRSRLGTARRIASARANTLVARWRANMRLRELDRARRPLLHRLGDAVWRGDVAAEAAARARLAEVDEERARAEGELEERIAAIDATIHDPRLTGEDTLTAAPTEPSPILSRPDGSEPPESAPALQPSPPPGETASTAPAPERDPPG